MAEGLSFSTPHFRSMQYLTMEIKEMRKERKKETSRGFQNGEGLSTSYEHYKQPMVQKVPQHPTMPTFLAEGNEWHGDGGYLEHETLSDYLAEYSSQSRAFKENINLQLFF